MKRKFWQWVHDKLEYAWHWVYRTKLAQSIPSQDAIFWRGSGEMGTLWWSKPPSDPEKWTGNPIVPEYPKMEEVGVDYYRVNPDGTYTLLDGPTDSAVTQ